MFLRETKDSELLFLCVPTRRVAEVEMAFVCDRLRVGNLENDVTLRIIDTVGSHVPCIPKSPLLGLGANCFLLAALFLQ